MSVDVYPPLDIVAQPVAVSARVRRSTSQLIPVTTNTPTVFDVLEHDSDGMWNAAQPDRLTVRTPGRYIVAGGARWAGGQTGGVERNTGIQQVYAAGGSAVIATSIHEQQNLGERAGTPVAIVDAKVGDYFQLVQYQDSAAGINLNPTYGPIHFQAALLSGNANGTPSGCRILRVAAGSHTTTGHFQAIAWDTVERDTDRLWDPATPTRLYARRAGWYYITASFLFALSNAGTQRIAAIVRGSDGQHVAQEGIGPSSSFYPRFSVAGATYLATGDWIEIHGWQDSGGVLGYLTNAQAVPFAVEMVRIDSTPPVSTRQPPSTRLGRRGTPQSLTANSGGQVTFDVVVEDNDNAGDAAAIDGITIRTPGRYMVKARVSFGANAVGRRQVTILLNGVPAGSMSVPAIADAGVETTVECSADLFLKAGDLLTAYYWYAGNATVTSLVAGASVNDLHPMLQATLIEPVSIAALMAPEAWHLIGGVGEPAFVSPWVNYGGPFNPAGFYKDPFGTVHLRGLITNGANGSNIFTLPVGYRPAYQELLVAIGNNALFRIDILTSGVVQLAAGQSSTWCSLDGMTFRAA